LAGGGGFEEEEDDQGLLVLEDEDADGVDVEEDEELMFYSYQTCVDVPGGGHPDPVVENASLAAIRPAQPRYEMQLVRRQPEIVTRNLLSSLQLETVLLASDRFEKRLPGDAAAGGGGGGGERARQGFFLGDGAGIGKGRQLAALVYEGWLAGRKRHIWVSTSKDLRFDAQRDLNDLMPNLPSHERIPVFLLPQDYGYMDRDGVVFLTYSTLCAGQREGSRSRYKQLLKWAQGWYWHDGGKKPFDGCLLFDESHRAKTLFVDGDSGTSSKAAQRVMDLQAALPDARVVYCSATGVSEPRHLAYMHRLGLWGPGTSFPEGFKTFLKTVLRSGVGAMEVCVCVCMCVCVCVFISIVFV
jgi:hypothetical protein